MTKTRRIYISIAFLLAVLIIVYIFFSLRRASVAEKVSEGFVLQSAEVIPIDAVAIFHFNDVNVSISFLSDTSGLFPSIFPQESPIGKFLSLSGTFGGEITLSFHYSAKNEVSPIAVLDLPPVPISGKESGSLRAGTAGWLSLIFHRFLYRERRQKYFSENWVLSVRVHITVLKSIREEG